MEKTNRGSARNKTIFNRIGAIGGAIGLVIVVVALVFGLNALLVSRDEQTSRTVSQLQQPISPPPPPSSDNLPEKDEDSISEIVLPAAPDSWPIYKSTRFHFSIKYPPGWFVLEAPPDSRNPFLLLTTVKPPVQIGEEADYQIILNGYPALGANTATEWINKSYSPTVIEPSDKKNVRVGNLVGIELSTLPSRTGSLNVVFLHKEFVYILTLGPYDPTNPQIAQRTVGAVEVFHQVTGSLQFFD